MSERPRSRTTIIVWWATVALMVALTAAIMAITTPWEDPAPQYHHKTKVKVTKTATPTHR